MASYAAALTTSSSRMQLVLWTTLALLLAFAATGDAIKCYQCTSAQNRNCGDPFVEGNVNKLECSMDTINAAVDQVKGAISDILKKFDVDIPHGTTQIDFVCQKIEHADKDGNEVVLRTCALNPDTADSCPPQNTGVQCYQCNGDLCNAAPVVAPALARLIILLLGPLAALHLLRP